MNEDVWLEIDGTLYGSRVADMEDGSLSIAYPACNGVRLRVDEGQVLVLISCLERGMQGFRSIVTACSEGPLPMLKVTPIWSLGTVQRRGFARVPDSLPVTFRVLTTHSRISGLSVDTYARNISGGGLRLYVRREKRPLVNDVLAVEVALPGGDPICLVAEVIWMSAMPNENEMFEIAVRFTDIREEDRKRIIRRVFAREADLHRAGLL